jgi:hypothetical protein
VQKEEMMNFSGRRNKMKKLRAKIVIVLAMTIVALIGLDTPAVAARIGYTTDVLISHYGSLDNPTISQGRTDLINDGHTLIPINSLTSSSLNGLDILVVGVVRDGSALGSAQVDVIQNFVLGGGGLVFLGENNMYFRSNNVMVGGRFGITYPTVDPPETVLSDVVLPRHAIMDGPYGQVNNLDGSNNSSGAYGSMLSPGPYGRSIIDFPGGNSAAVVIEPGAIGAGSGPVVAFAEINIWDSGKYFGADNRALWRNTFAYVPEPATMALLASGGLALLRKRRA